ncbi:MAG: polysaccharide deacetylase family protein [bacterium]|nr:polysaccharide deacetylase family protein [bacterium]
MVGVTPLVRVLRRRSVVMTGLALLALAFSLADAGTRAGMQHALAASAGVNRRLPIYAVATDEQVLAISFDAAWGSERTPEILEVLARYDVRTTFFLVGFWIDRYPEVLRQIVDAGHEVGNHTASHPHLNSLSREQIARELEIVHRQLEEATGKAPYLFRPPFGEYSNKVIEVAEELGYLTIQWSVDSLDWKDVTARQIAARVLDRAHPGAIILFHNNAENTPVALPAIIETLQTRGYRVVPISELVRREDFYIDHRGFQHPRRDPR